MQPIFNPDSTGNGHTGTCVNCGCEGVIPGYRHALCGDCRSYFVRFPIPRWVQLFGAAVLLLLALALTQFPKRFSAALSLQRAKQAIQQKKYVTAQRRLQDVVADQPGCLDAKKYLAVAAFYNFDFAELDRMDSILAGTDIEETNAADNELDYVLRRYKDYYPSDSLRPKLDAYKDSAETLQLSLYNTWLQQYPDDFAYITTLYASACISLDKYAMADSLLNTALHRNGNHMRVLRYKVYLKQQLHQSDSALYFCDRILAINKEATIALAPKARILLRQGKKKDALQLAEESYSLSQGDAYSMATLALAYHFNKKFGERDRLIQQASHDSVQASYMEYARDVISGKENFNP
ncbi:tetratricopeptide repeat protein [Deminuibacter soli]|uniref:Tetratricopeptide repeat protein n=1 Tax=Deminuibacter soli TaxID=2291815 RepID=A0A3E1NKW8_9BACT|nr:hypothetical protein [Deminuibacter soli]RFM28573.1 hypothetical protein DXN05_07180 [Deminuibacter soli]